MKSRIDRTRRMPALVALAAGLWAGAAHAQDAPARPAPAPTPVPAPEAATPGTQSQPDAATAPTVNGDANIADTAPADGSNDDGLKTDIFSKNTLSMLVDARLVVSNGQKSWTNNGLGKTRFQGTSNGDYMFRAVPVEADLIWQPRFTGSLTANVSAAWQRDQENPVDLIEAFLNYLPQNSGKISFSARAGLMWPEISMEHSTGGAWSVVNTITPSAINSWVGEEVKVLGVEGTLHASLGQHELALTGAVFGGNDTSGTLLSFRGWALHDEKATGFGHFELPPRSQFLTGAQQGLTRSTLEIDGQPGFYGRLDWRPPWPFGIAVFYYDNRGEPEKFNKLLQWGWRTRFWNVGINADLGPRTKMLIQGMSGSTIMGFQVNGDWWVHTFYNSAYLELIQQMNAKTSITGRIEYFGTREHGTEMQGADGGENGWALTLATRWNITNNLTGFVEALHVYSNRSSRVPLLGLPAIDKQNVLQASLRLRL